MQLLKFFLLVVFLLQPLQLNADAVSGAEMDSSSFENDTDDGTSADSGSGSEGPPVADYKPAVDVHVYEFLAQNKYADGIVYWHLGNPGLLAQPLEAGREKTWNEKKYRFSVHRTNMLEELPAFLSRKALHPKVYVITGIITEQDVVSLMTALQVSYFDRLTAASDGLRFARSRSWKGYRHESGGVLVLSFYGFPDDVSPLVEGVYVDDPHSGKNVHVGNMMTIRVKLDEQRTTNLLTYFVNDFNLAALKKRVGFDVGQPSVDRHPAVIGLGQALNRARATFGSSRDPLIVTSNINIPLFPAEPNGLACHLDQTLQLDIRVSPQSCRGNFNTMKNPLASYTLETSGSVDYLHNDSSSELLDFIGLEKQYGDSRNKMTMQVVEFTSAGQFSFPVEKVCVPDQKLLRPGYLNRAKASADILAGMDADAWSASEQVTPDYSISTASGHYPVYAELVIPEHQPIDPESFCQTYAYPIFDMAAFRGGEVVTIDIHVVNEILRFAKELLPNNSGAFIMVDRQQKVYAIPDRSGSSTCSNEDCVNWSDDAGFGKLEKTRKGYVLLKDMMLRGKKTSLWQTVIGSNPYKYAAGFIRSTVGEFDYNASAVVNGRQFNYKVYRLFRKKPWDK